MTTATTEADGDLGFDSSDRQGLERMRNIGKARWLRGQATEITAAAGPDGGRATGWHPVAVAELPRLSALSADRAGTIDHPVGARRV
jgi:hypothetical protein